MPELPLNRTLRVGELGVLWRELEHVLREAGHRNLAVAFLPFDHHAPFPEILCGVSRGAGACPWVEDGFHVARKPGALKGRRLFDCASIRAFLESSAVSQ